MEATLETPRMTLELDPEQQRHPAPATTAPPSTPALVEGPASAIMKMMDRGYTPDFIERMMGILERNQKAENERAYNVAFAAFKAKNIRIAKSTRVTDGPLRGKAYAELHAVVDAVTPALAEQGLSFNWKLTIDKTDWLEITCTLKHVSGHSESASMGGAPDVGAGRNAAQARMSTRTYLERATLKDVCGVAEGGDDTDGNTPPPQVPLELSASARAAAAGGWNSLAKFMKSLKEDQRAVLQPEEYALKRAARTADSAKKGNAA